MEMSNPAPEFGTAINEPSSPDQQQHSLPMIKKGQTCPHCSWQFTKNHHYDRHVRSHTNEKPFGCKICGKFYPRHDTLLRHFKTHRDIRGKKGPSSMIGRNGAHEIHQNTLQSAIGARSFDDPSSVLPTTPVLVSDSDPAWTTFDLPMADIHEGSNVAPSTTVFLQSERTGKPPSAGSEVTEQSSTRTSALTATSTTSADISDGFPCHEIMDVNDHPVDDTTFADSLTQFDPSNWLLDEYYGDIIDVASIDLTCNDNDPRNSNARSSSSAPDPLLGGICDNFPTILDLRRMWYIQVRSAADDLDSACEQVGRQRVNTSSDRRDIDEAYRRNMVENLRGALRNESLPSLDFLNLCMHLFFRRFNVALPLIHGPTFRPSSENILLVLCMCFAGAMMMNSNMAIRIGSALFTYVCKAGNASPWERRLSEQPHLTRDNIKGAAIGQTYAILSSDPAHRALAAAYQGSTIALGRHIKLFTETSEVDLSNVSLAEDLDKTWRKWARDEEMRRAAVIMHIQDAEIAALFHHEPIFRHNASRLPAIAPREVFLAQTAAIWAIKYRAYQKSRQVPTERLPNETRSNYLVDIRDLTARTGPALLDNIRQRSFLNSWASLSGIAATICEYRHLDLLTVGRIGAFEDDLMIWYTSNAHSSKTDELQTLDDSPFALTPLWHYTCLLLTTDLNMLELAVGREGTTIATTTLNYIKTWISSPESKRCLVHALCLQNLVASSTVDSVVGMHTGRILFSAALCWYCYMLYAPWCSVPLGSGESRLTGETIEYLMALPETRLMQLGSSSSAPFASVYNKAIMDLKRLLEAKPVEIKASTLCVLESSLRQTTGISRNFADLIQAFICGETQ